MVIVWGSVETTAADLEKVMALSLAHVERSRLEPGCEYHSVQVDAENEHRLVFFEKWTDMNALMAHFALEESKQFVASASASCVSPPVMEIYDASKIEL